MLRFRSGWWATMLCSANVKEGTSITVYGEGDENFTRIEIGVPKKKTLL